MTKDSLYDSFLTLLQAGLWNRTPDLGLFPLSNEEWGSIYAMARKQTVEAIVYDGLLLLPDHYYPPQLLLIKWTLLVDQVELRNRQMDCCIEELAYFFAQNNLKALLLKGQGVAACYCIPHHRVCGDIDWFFPDESHFRAACALMKSKGAHLFAQTRSSVAYEWNGILVEHHKHMIDIHNPFVQSYLRKLQKEEMNNCLCQLVGWENVLLPSPLLTHLSVHSHILKHMFMYGAGLRQLCDSALLYKTYHESCLKEQLEVVYRKAGIYKWMQILHKLLVDYLAMPSEYLPFPLSAHYDVRWLMTEIFDKGNFGFYDKRFMNKKDTVWLKKWKGFCHLYRFLPYVPLETGSFFVTVTYSRIKNSLSK